MKFISGFFLAFSSLSFAVSPKCDAPTSWAPSMAYVYLTNHNVIKKDEVDHSKTVVNRMASEKIGNDIYRQIHHVSFKLKTGKVVEVITSNDASSEECSQGTVDVFLISTTYSDHSA
ncbi:hypothetical protein A3K86_22385 [Photobacterium jeanii]|uniref:Uncharacterized protein n=1 Tax=Photobacterium jeanii TaxID=858640 RepID=A0A178K3Y8_9GAMM|nr:hypothetical protein [Photobacterium jeanii]OAN11665.1 hypothetical protein A3K86_22385 [Photobacterium jeanii]PST91188.1 hypothetical protein C9I91_11500 [Photobacterium jeanii]